MREILFRAKINRTESKWVEGFYVHVPCGRFLCDEHMIQTIDEDGRIGMLYNIYESTLGQFTGLTDKNGKKIFEGDIVRCIRTMCDEKEMVGHILYDDCCFSVKENRTPNQPAMDLCDDFEVIGNIHDNPELLEEAKAIVWKTADPNWGKITGFNGIYFDEDCPDYGAKMDGDVNG